MRQSEFEQHVGQHNVCASVAEALYRASALLVEIQSAPPPVALLQD
jgi:hypothetical protein